MGEKIENGTIHVGEIIGKTLDGKDIYKFTEVGTAENVEIREPHYKEGDFAYDDGRIMIVKSYPANYHALVLPYFDDEVVYDDVYDLNFSEPTFRYATEEEKQILIDAMRKGGKRWNEEKKCIEDIPKRKFQKGDKVRIKAGVSSKTHGSISPIFVTAMDKLIGKELTVEYYGNLFVRCDGYYFLEEWLEPYVEELKKGDLAIFWDDYKEFSTIRIYDRSNESEEYFRHKDQNGVNWKNAIKFESKEQYEKLINGEL